MWPNMTAVIWDVWEHIKSLKPAFLSRNPHFNFSTVHCKLRLNSASSFTLIVIEDFYIIGMSILCSLCLFIKGGIPYIDALFFASGAATQSGLNTIDINLLNTWQQVAIYITATMCNPVTINTFVVFLRLYWFEKRFQHVVKETMRNRRSFAKSFTKSKDDPDLDRVERGVRGRNINVMYDTTRTNGLTNDGHMKKEPIDGLNEEVEVKDMANREKGGSSLDESNETRREQSYDSGGEPLKPTQTPPQPQVQFSPQVKRSNGLSDRTLSAPFQRSQEDHIRILQRQRNQESNDEPRLRIPGPRDADAGISPHAVLDSEVLSHTLSQDSRGSQHVEMGTLNDDARFEDNHSPTDTRGRRNITIQEPAPRPRTPPTVHLAENGLAAKNVLSILTFRGRSTEKKHVDINLNAPDRKKSSTWNSLKNVLSTSKDDNEIPYLSWQPTIGRNSIFIDLTEEQREELGGIEYRSLKTLAVLLTAYNVGFGIIGVIGLVPWILTSDTWGPVVDADSQGRVWWGFFTSMSAFTDLGFTLTPDSMISFEYAVWPLLLMSFLIVIGNTGFPVMLRFIIWATARWIPASSSLYEELRFLLDHPRRCFTLLFPSKANWILFWILVGLNGLDLIFFLVLDVCCFSSTLTSNSLISF
jgi:potassium uptake Trk family protein